MQEREREEIASFFTAGKNENAACMFFQGIYSDKYVDRICAMWP